ncbi:MAG: arylsulfatase [Opitutales bacterium]|nr:arylsulfatase [Opitutales bacterium]
MKIPLSKRFAFTIASLFLVVPALLYAKTNNPHRASSSKPNIIVILVDDMGYSDIGCYGGEIPTPHIDNLASNGLRFSQFYNTARCCPTRASLLTGLYQHQAGIGMMTGAQSEWVDSYQGYLNQNSQTIAEVLKTAGYHTYITGKWHVGRTKSSMWPLQRGFDRYYGIIGGSSNYFTPKGLMLDNEELPIPNDPDYYTTDQFTDYALKFLKEQKDDNPFFLYVAYNAPHWPLNARDEDIEKFKGKFLHGWDKLREERWKRQVEMGLVDEKWGLSPRSEEVRAWDALSEQDQEELDYRMAVYAAMMYRVDINIGRIVEHLEKTKQLDNTLILFLSDNGGCPEPWGTLTYRGHSDLGGGRIDLVNDRSLGGSGGRQGTNGSSYGEGWANASNTPFRLYKTQSHEGGISTPLVVHWPKGLKTKEGMITHAPGHIIDIMATAVDLADASYPEVVNGQPIHPMQGKSLRKVFETGTRRPHEWLFWEHSKEGAVRTGDWKAVYRQSTEEWFLYNIGKDRNELYDLSTELPEVLSVLKRKWWEWAVVNKVEPQSYSLSQKFKRTASGDDSPSH